MPLSNPDSQNKDILLPPEVKAMVQQAWEVRTAHFPMEFTAVSPEQTKAVSVTGSNCSLDCAHCGRHYLKGMVSLETVLSENTTETDSYLISGGSTREGKVPLLPHISRLRRLGEKARLNLHPGLVNSEEAHALAEVADVVSFDFVGSTRVIRKVYGLEKDVSDYIKSYRYLVESLGIHRVVPHITIGLDAGQVSDEIEWARILAYEGLSRLALLVFIPTKGTLFEKSPAPSLADVVATIAEIRTIIPTVPLYLGCMRPGGNYRRRLDPLALKCGVNKIVQPARNVEKAAGDLGLTIIYERECCSL